MASKTSHIILLGTEWAKTGQCDKLRDLLNKFPIENISIEQSDDLALLFLNSAERGQQKECTKIIMERWEETMIGSENGQSLPYYVYLFTSRKIDNEVLGFISKVMDKYSFEEVMDYLIDYDDGEDMYLAYNRARNIYGDRGERIYRKLLHRSKEQDNIRASNFLENLIKDIATYAEVPSWVKDYRTDKEQDKEQKSKETKSKESVEDLPTESDLLLELPPYDVNPRFEMPTDIEQAVLDFTSGLEDMGIEIESIGEARDAIRNLLLTGSTQEKIQILGPMMQNKARFNLAYNKDIFRILGPSNPIIGSDLTGDSPCERYGGCRLLTCKCLELLDPETGQILDYDDVNWFTGSCDVCLKQIRISAHAIRLPEVTGGWSGCYCSWQCIRNGLIGPDPMQRGVIDQFEITLSEIGIQDRQKDPVMIEEE